MRGQGQQQGRGGSLLPLVVMSNGNAYTVDATTATAVKRLLEQADRPPTTTIFEARTKRWVTIRLEHVSSVVGVADEC